MRMYIGSVNPFKAMDQVPIWLSKRPRWVILLVGFAGLFVMVVLFASAKAETESWFRFLALMDKETLDNDVLRWSLIVVGVSLFSIGVRASLALGESDPRREND